jgi:hypothetical protein
MVLLTPLALHQIDLLRCVFDWLTDISDVVTARNVCRLWRRASSLAVRKWFDNNLGELHLAFKGSATFTAFHHFHRFQNSRGPDATSDITVSFCAQKPPSATTVLGTNVIHMKPDFLLFVSKNVVSSFHHYRTLLLAQLYWKELGRIFAPPPREAEHPQTENAAGIVRPYGKHLSWLTRYGLLDDPGSYKIWTSCWEELVRARLSNEGRLGQGVTITSGFVLDWLTPANGLIEKLMQPSYSIYYPLPFRDQKLSVVRVGSHRGKGGTVSFSLRYGEGGARRAERVVPLKFPENVPRDVTNLFTATATQTTRKRSSIHCEADWLVGKSGTFCVGLHVTMGLHQWAQLVRV